MCSEDRPSLHMNVRSRDAEESESDQSTESNDAASIVP